MKKLFSAKTLMNKRNFFILYTLIFLVMIFAVYGVFFFNGKSFIFSVDGWEQHYTALIYYSKWLRSIVRSVLFEHTLSIPTFSFSIGYGSDIIDTLQYYVIGDPFALFSVFVPTRFIANYYNIMYLARLYLAGLTFSLFCFYKKDQITERGKFGSFSEAAILIGSFVYVFCGYEMHACLMHPFFANAAIYFPLILLGVERVLDRKKPWLFIVMIFVSAISNFYFFYMILILTVLYVIWRLVVRFTRKQIRTAFALFGKLAGGAVLGTGMGALLLLPVVRFFFEDSRSESGYIYNFFYSRETYEGYLGNFLSLENSHDWTTLGYVTIGLIAILLLFLQKGYRDLKAAVIVLTIMTLLPVVGSAMNGFSYPANRWIWAYSFLIAYIVVVKWQDLFCLTAKEKWELVFCLGVYTVFCVVLVKSRSDAVFFALTVMFLSIILVFAVSERFGTRWAQVALAVCVLANISGNALFYSSPRNMDAVGLYKNNADTLVDLEETEAIPIWIFSEGEDQFFRYTGDSTTTNGTLYSGLNSTQYYWSLGNGNISQFRVESALTDNLMYQNYRTLDNRTILSTLANVRYYVQDETAPYGFSYVDEFEIDSEKEENYTIWSNDHFLPFGYTYSSYISREEYDAMSPLEKQEALLQGCVIESSSAKGEQADISFTGESISYQVDIEDGISYEDGCIRVTQKNSVLTLTINGLQNAETYLYLKNLSYSGYTPRELYSDEEWDELSKYEKNEVNYSERYYEEDTELNVQVTAEDTQNNITSKKLTFYTPKYRFYSGRTDFMVNLGYDENAQLSITLKFPSVGEYKFDSMEVLCQPMENYANQVSDLAEDVMTNVDFHENAVFATNQVTGEIDLNRAKYLLLTIPYSDGWTAYVDGEKQELIQANTMYMALYLEAGEHRIQLIYHTPSLRTGLIISCISIVIFVLWIVATRINSRVKKRKSNDSI